MFNSYIKECIASGRAVNIITVNGYQMLCKILNVENDCIVVLAGYKKKLVYKHAISTIEPASEK